MSTKSTVLCPTCKGAKSVNGVRCGTCQGVGQIVERLDDNGKVRQTKVLNEG